MKVSMIKWFGTLVAGLFAALAAPASAQLSTTANGPYYATPSWDQKLTTNRFVILANWNNEAVLDRETGLVWQRSPSQAGVIWAQAVLDCMGVGTGGRFGWRLPTMHELGSLADPAGGLQAGNPFTGVDMSGLGTYWSSTTFPGNSLYAMVRGFPANGSSFGSASKSDSRNFKWCVRGGQGVDSNPF